MPDVRFSVYSRATTHAGLSTLIGTRCWPKRLPETPTLPCMTYDIVSFPDAEQYVDHDTNGTANSRGKHRIQLDGYANTPDEAAALGIQMFVAFQGWHDKSLGVGSSFVKNKFNADSLSIDAHREVVEIVVDQKF